mgnify:CR=1 FL=1
MDSVQSENDTEVQPGWVRWTAHEEALVEKYYHEKGSGWCGQQLGRTASSVKNKASALGVAKPVGPPVWDDAADLCLVENYAKRGAKYCAEELGVTHSAVRSRAYKLGLAASSKERCDWSEVEVEWLLANYATLGAAECAGRLNRSISSVESKMQRLRAASGRTEQVRSSRAWEKEDEENLKILLNWIGGFFACSVNTVINKAVGLRTADKSWMDKPVGDTLKETKEMGLLGGAE